MLCLTMFRAILCLATTPGHPAPPQGKGYGDDGTPKIGRQRRRTPPGSPSPRRRDTLPWWPSFVVKHINVDVCCVSMTAHACHKRPPPSPRPGRRGRDDGDPPWRFVVKHIYDDVFCV